MNINTEENNEKFYGENLYDELTWDGRGFAIVYFFIESIGIVDNLLVILSISRKRSLLKSNYYYTVLHLAICDLGSLLCDLLASIMNNYLTVTCFFDLRFSFFVAGIQVMATISVLRYHATVHPLKPAISPRKLNTALVAVYVLSLFVGYLMKIPSCSTSVLPNIQDLKDFLVHYRNVHMAVATFGVIFSTFLMTLMYLKTAMALFTRNTSRVFAMITSVGHQRQVRNRKAFHICFATLVCFLLGLIPMSVIYLIHAGGYHFPSAVQWLKGAVLLRIAGCHAANPFVYGVFDRKIITFWKHCREKKYSTATSASTNHVKVTLSGTQETSL